MTKGMGDSNERRGDSGPGAAPRSGPLFADRDGLAYDLFEL